MAQGEANAVTQLHDPETMYKFVMNRARLMNSPFLDNSSFKSCLS